MGERRQRVALFRLKVEPTARRADDANVARLGDNPCDSSPACVDNMLAVIEEQERVLGGQECNERVGQILFGRFRYAKYARDGWNDEALILQGTELDEPDAIREPAAYAARQPSRKV